MLSGEEKRQVSSLFLVLVMNMEKNAHVGDEGWRFVRLFCEQLLLSPASIYFMEECV